MKNSRFLLTLLFGSFGFLGGGVALAQGGLTLVEDSTMVAETEIYEDSQGNIWADIVKVQFIGHVAVVNPGTKTFGIGQIDPSFPDVIDLLDSFTVNEGLTHLEKVLPDAVYGDTLRPNVRTGAMVPIPEYSQLVNLRFATPVFVDSIATILETLAAVKYTEGPFIDFLLGDPNDYDYTSQWQLQRVNAPWAWDLTHGDAGGVPVRIAIPDSFPCNNTNGFRLHMDLRDRLTMRTTCSTSPVAGSTHGVSVAGVAGAITNNGAQPITMGFDEYDTPHDGGGITGVASLGWNVLLNGYASTSAGFVAAVLDIGSAFEFRVINASFGTHIHVVGNTVSEAVKAFLRTDVIVVGGAGNNPPPPVIPAGFYPAGYTWMDFGVDGQQPDLIGKQVIAAAATDLDDTVVTCYNYSPCGDAGQPPCDPLNPAPRDSSFIDIASPGFGIEVGGGAPCPAVFNSGLFTLYSSYYAPTGGTYLSSNSDRVGTSFASPMVAAAAALLISVNPDLGPREVYEAITKSAEKLDPAGADYITLSNGDTWSRRIGYGQLDAYGALKYAIEKWGGTLGGVGDTLTFHEDFDLDATVELAFRAGTTIQFAPGVTFSADKITAVGTTADSIRFVPLYDLAQNPDSTWGGLLITGSGSRIENAVFEGADIAGEVRGVDVRIEASRFEDNGTAVLTDYATGIGSPLRSDLALYSNEVSGSSSTSLVFRNANVAMFYTTVSNNEGPGILVENADLWPFVQNTVSGNSGAPFIIGGGIAVLGGGDVEMTAFNGNSGFNVFSENVAHETSVYAGGGLLIGGGENTILKATAPGPGSRYVYNASGVRVNALRAWWGSGSGPPAGAFSGDVKYVPYLPCDPAVCRQAGNQMVSTNGPTSHLRSGEAGEGRSEEWKAWALSEILTTRAALLAAPAGREAPALVRYLAFVQGLDRGDELGENASTRSVLRSLRAYLEGDHAPALRQTAAAALAAEVRASLRMGEIDEAEHLLSSHGVDAQNDGLREDNLALQLSEVTIHEANERYGEALSALRTLIASLDPEMEEELVEKLSFVAGLIERRADSSPSRPGESLVSIDGVPTQFALDRAYPNPFNPRATIPFALPEASHVTLTVYDVLGRRIAVLADGRYEAGRHNVLLDGGRMASGLYLVRILMEPEGGGAARAFVQRLTLLK